MGRDHDHQSSLKTSPLRPSTAPSRLAVRCGPLAPSSPVGIPVPRGLAVVLAALAPLMRSPLPAGSRRSPLASPRASPLASPRVSPLVSPRVSPLVSPRVSPLAPSAAFGGSSGARRASPALLAGAGGGSCAPASPV